MPSRGRSGERDAYAVLEVNGGLGCAALLVSGDGERSVGARRVTIGQGAIPVCAMRRGKTTSVIRSQGAKEATEPALALDT